ncbi:hypothetical protein AB4305_09120 [Nocardia sp. 2YAB30]|uniref:hypothetical protein n=1 Tax=unclassified Nocardia TaxID=2637762 RepID=UPI003F9C8A00
MSTTRPRKQARIPRWFVLWMGLLAAFVAVSCLALFWQLAAEGTLPTIVVLWFVLGVLGMIALLFGLLGLLRYRAFFHSLISPLLIGILVVLVWFDIPETVGWRLSRAILEDQATDCANPGHRTRLGVYAITYITSRDGGCLFYTQAHESNSAGFAYFRDTATPPHIGPPATNGVRYETFEGHWYRFVEDH